MLIGLVGLGKMGGNMALRLIQSGHHIVGYDQDYSLIQSLDELEKNITAINNIEEFRNTLNSPRIVWVMVPSGNPIESVVNKLSSVLEVNDIIIDGGNSNYKETMKRSKKFADLGIHYIDVGTSGGVWGLKEGYSLMIGGDKSTINFLSPIFEALAPNPNKGWGRVGPSGSGHFVKMIHNGIEYGMMQAMAEGFELLKAKKEFNFDLAHISEIWKDGSVIRSWLLDLTTNALKLDKNLENIKSWVEDSGEGRWTVFESIDLNVPAPVITLSLMMRFISRQEESFSAKLLSAMRNQFGGHELPR